MNRFFLVHSIQCLAIVLLAVCFIAPYWLHAGDVDDGFDSQRWEKDIQAFEAKEQESLPEEGGVVFVGSSSIRKWDLDKFFPDQDFINRGFGGSHMEDSVYYADRIVLPYKPRTVVVYAGDNDINDGKTPQRVLNDFKKFVRIVHENLPRTNILYIAIKPCVKRWDKVDKVREANRLISEYAKKDKHVDFVDIDAPMMGEDCKPRRSLFEEDELHLNDEGYRLWTSLLKPFLQEKPLADE
ncbi:MAG: hypothetical protein JXR73_20070 [Candidatus Omnitrophica bacterium]|nr:hypothetical protein [Candidatus Omnitrophota bacterium]